MYAGNFSFNPQKLQVANFHAVFKYACLRLFLKNKKIKKMLVLCTQFLEMLQLECPENNYVVSLRTIFHVVGGMIEFFFYEFVFLAWK